MDFTHKEMQQFKKIYADTKAKDGPSGTFMFKDSEFRVSYAKYVIEWWEMNHEID